jgi:hypothetical protein
MDMNGFIKFFQGVSSFAGVMNVYAGTYEKERTHRIGGYAGASVAEASAHYSIFGASATALSASAHYEVGLNNSIGASATLARAEAHAGPLGIGVGLSLNTGWMSQAFDLTLLIMF